MNLVEIYVWRNDAMSEGMAAIQPENEGSIDSDEMQSRN